MNKQKKIKSSEVTTTDYRVKPSIPIAIGIYVLYMTIFSAIWIINDVDYTTIGKTLESTKLHYAMPTIISSLAVAIVLTYLGWWKITLFDKEKSGPKWAWIGAIAMFAFATTNFAIMNTEGLNFELIFYSILGAIGVGFGEEMITRGSLVVALRTKYSEKKVWLFSTLAFSALHIPNMFFGSPVYAVLVQLVLTFIFGSLLYGTRRLSGTLLLPMFLHGFWDSSLFLPGATNSPSTLLVMLIYPIAIVCVWGLLKFNKQTVLKS